MATIHHALVLNLHQPAGNLEMLLDKPNPEGEDGWEGKEILFSMDRIPRVLWPYEGLAKVHLSMSGTLLETLSDPRFQDKTYGVVKCGDLLWYLQNERLFEILGTGYYHPVLPLIPQHDWEEQLLRWQGIGRHLFWRTKFPGFWPPEMGFCMEMIPVLRKLGYEYVMVDSENVRPVTPMRWEEIRYRPHFASYGGESIVVVVRDRQLSDAQESGMELGWFISEVESRTRWCDFPPLVTTCTDGDNGGWFRNFNDGANFWHVFYKPLLERLKEPAEVRVEPTFIKDYLAKYGAHGEVTVDTAAWNTGWHHGRGFIQWTGSQTQKEALERVHRLSRTRRDLEIEIERSGKPKPPELEQAYWRILRAETSCNFFWGESWVDRCNSDLDEAKGWLEKARQAVL